MQLNEVIEENSLATISKRTRISIDNIEKLVNKDFSKIKRVKALGFISILEREFGVKLDELRRECIEYFALEPEEEFDTNLVITIPESYDRPGGHISKLIVLLVLFAIGYGAWHFLVNKEEPQENNSTVKSTGFIGSVVSQAREWMGSGNALDSDSIPASTEGVWAKKDLDSKQNHSKGAVEDNGSDNDTVVYGKIDEKNDSALEEQIIRDVKEEQKEIIAKELEKSDTQEASIEGIATQADEALAVEVPSMVDETNADEVKAISKKTKQNSIVTLYPSKKVWVGYTNLSTMRRAAKVTDKELDFDTSESSWILVTGHSSVNFMVDEETVSPQGKGKSYFLIKDGGVKNISQEEFQKLNKSTVW
ncbi:MAG: hypothetical protein HF962_04730 [Sulfurovum sp.]|nr:hypothetical protein [Sulfurovum sp.]